MFSKQHKLAKVTILTVVLVSVVVLSLALVSGSSEAAGPGGRGRGNGNSGGGSGANGQGQSQGQGIYDQTQQQLMDCTGTGTQTNAAWQSANGQGQGQGQGEGIYDQTQQQLMDCTGTAAQTGSTWQGTNGKGNANANGIGTGAMGGGLLLDLPPATPGELPADVIDAMTAGIMDEYHAYQTYQAVIAQFGDVRPFTNIMRAEQGHIEALSFMFERYGLDVPQAGTLTGVPQFDSVEEACALGASAEIANLHLYDEWMATVSDYPDLVQVFTSLRDASEFQHLPAFEVCAS